ncbi:MAG TPA: class I SAM-dependent methyltransferase [Baekduia sp.]|nr:class I SAM-dependent methyltransferase [Baekduia sp.]
MHMGADSRTTNATRAGVHELAQELGIQVWRAPAGTPRRQLIARAARESLRGRLPERYATDTWHVPFRPRLQEALQPGIRILDLGAGARPMVPPQERPPGCTYVGFDVDADELRKAPAGSYDDYVVGDVCTLHDDLVGQFDLVLSWLTMEHVKPVPDALENLSRYQRPGGRFLGYLSGSWSAHAFLNRVVPHGLAKAAMRRTLDREPDTVFRAHYDHCWYDALEAIGRRCWSRAEIVPVFTGGWYFRFSPALRAPYMAYEEWAVTGGHRNLAAYYILDAVA